MNHLIRLCCVLLMFVLSGCFPEERIWWSPQGDRAIIRVEDVLHLMSADGALGAPLLGGASVKDWAVQTLTWLPDGTGFLCARTRKVRTWEETQHLVAAEECKQVEQWLPAVLPTLEGIIAQNTSLEKLGQLISATAERDRLLFTAALRVVFETQRGEVERVLKKLPQALAIITELTDAETGFDVQELCVVQLDQPTTAPPRSLLRALLTMPVIPKVSPKHAVVAFLQLRDDKKTVDLKVMTLDGTATLTVEQDISTGAFEWMPDGCSLIFTTAMGKADDSIQMIRHITALQSSGALMKPRHDKQPDGSLLKIDGPDRLPDPKTLAMAILPAHQTLQALPDGRILFASQPITLPAVGAGPELAPQFYLIGADLRSVQAIPTVPGDLPTDLNFFVASPDGRHIAVVEEGTDAVALVEVNTGKTTLISPPHPGWRCETVPAWKSANELTFAGLDETSKVPGMMLWTASGGVRSLSTSWQPKNTSDWLSESKSAEPKKETP